MAPDGMALVEFFFNELLLLVIAVTLGMKSLVLRRITSLGRALAVNNVMFTVAYLTLFLAPWVRFFRSDAWSWTIRSLVLMTALTVLWQLKETFGGWRGIFDEARHGIIVWRNERIDGKDGY